MEALLASFPAWAQGVLSDYGLAGVVIAFQALCNVYQYLGNQKLHADLRGAERGFRAETQALLEERLADYQAIAPVLAENVESNRAVAKTMGDNTRIVETLMLRETTRRRT